MPTRFPLPLAAFLVLAALVPLAPVAPAQAPELSTTLEVALAPLEAPIPPGAAPVALAGEVRYTVQDGVPAMGKTRIVLSVEETPAWASAVLDPGAVEVTLDPATGTPGAMRTYTAAFSVLVTASADAPAFQEAPVRVAASAAANSPHAASRGEAETPVRAAYTGRVTATVSPAAVEIGPDGAARANVTVVNQANGATKVTFEVVAPEGIEVVPLLPVTLDSRATGGSAASTTQTVGLTLRALPAFAEAGTISVRVVAAYAQDPAVPATGASVSIAVSPAPDADDDDDGRFLGGALVVEAIAWIGAVAVLLAITRRGR